MSVLTASQVIAAGSCRTEPRPSASRFLCAENRRSSLRSSSERLWQYRTSLSWGGSWCSSCRTRYRSPTEFTYGTLSSGSAEKYTCTYGNKSKSSYFEKMPELTAGYRIRELHFEVTSMIIFSSDDDEIRNWNNNVTRAYSADTTQSKTTTKVYTVYLVAATNRSPVR